MSKIITKIMAASASIAIFAAFVSAGTPSLCGAYQPKEPKCLKEMAAKRSKSCELQGYRYTLDDMHSISSIIPEAKKQFLNQI